MKELKEFNIPFVGLKEGNHLFEYQIDNTFFEHFNFEDFNEATINITVTFIKKSTLLELNFKASGSVNVPCDVSGEDFNQQIEGELPLIVKFGHEFNDEGDEIIVLPHEAYQINVAQYVYELVVLSVPSKRIHPQVLDGTMESETLKKLEELETKQNNIVEEESSTDPRWDKLKDLLTDK